MIIEHDNGSKKILEFDPKRVDKAQGVGESNLNSDTLSPDVARKKLQPRTPQQIADQIGHTNHASEQSREKTVDQQDGVTVIEYDEFKQRLDERLEAGK